MKRHNDLSFDPESFSPSESSNAARSQRLLPEPASARGLSSDVIAPPCEPASRVDPWIFAEALVKRWYWLVFAGAAMAALAVLAGVTLWKTRYTATVQLIRLESPVLAEVFRERQTSMQTFTDLLRTPELVRRVRSTADLAMSPEALTASVVITPERNKENLTIAVTQPTPELAAEVANLYAQEAVNYTKKLQGQDIAALNDHLQQQVSAIDGQMKRFEESAHPTRAYGPVTPRSTEAVATNATVTVETETLPVPRVNSAGSDELASITRAFLVEQMRLAHQELATLLTQYTEANTLVQQQRLKLAHLESQYSNAVASVPKPVTAPVARIGLTSPTNPMPLVTASQASTVDLEIARNRAASLEAARLPLAARQQFLQNLMQDPPGQLQLLAPATPKTAVKNGREIKIGAIAAVAGMFGVTLAAALILLAEALSRRLKTEDDVQRVTRLPVLATLGDLRKVSGVRRDQWSFRVWNSLQGRLVAPANHGLMCGIISSTEGEGRTTWMQLLAKAASQRGYRVLTIRTQSDGRPGRSGTNGDYDSEDAPTVTANVLASPGDVAHRLVGAHPHVIVDISLPDWSWNMERRKQLEAALDHWSAIENVVILVNLPPASEPQSVLLASELTNLVWLADSGRADAATTRSQIETLRHGRCHLVGAFLNHAPSHPLKTLFPRWVAA